MKRLGIIILLDSLALMLLGLIIVLSASSSFSQFKFDNIFYLFNYHLVKVIIALCFMAIFIFIPYEYYKELSKPAIFLISFVLIITLFFAPNYKGAGRWLNLGLFSFQPAEIARIILIVHLSTLLVDKKDLLKNYRNGFLYLFFWVVVICGLILVQPNISNGFLLGFIALTLMYVGGAKLKHILASSFLSGLSILSAAMIFPHSRERILDFVRSFINGSDPNIQVKQAVLSLGSGGLFGVGLGHSKQNNLFLPEAYGDFIFAILGEELGFVGVVTIMLGFMIIFIAGILIAKKTKDPFGQLLAFGITISISVYAFVNIAVTTGLLPTTGLPLPFISYGGTSVIVLGIAVGMLSNIAFYNARLENQVSVNQFTNTGKAVI